jgi:hypothetical protein
VTRARRKAVTILGVFVTATVVGVVAAFFRGQHTLGVDDRQAATIARTTASLERQIGGGRYVAEHLTTEIADARRLSAALPASIDDQSILAGVVAATGASGVQLTNEQRSQLGTSSAASATTTPGVTGPSGSPGAALVRLPLTVTVIGPNQSSLIAFAAALQHQRRLLSIGSLSLTATNGATLQLTGSAFERSSPLPLSRSSAGNHP